MAFPIALLATLMRATDLKVHLSNGTARVSAVAPDVFRLDWTPDSGSDKPTDAIDPKGLRGARAKASATGNRLKTDELTAIVDGSTLRIDRGDEQVLAVDLEQLAHGTVSVQHAADEPLYGMRGIALWDPEDPRLDIKNGYLRTEGAPVSGAAQGDGGAPFAFSSHWGVFVDSVDGQFNNSRGTLTFTKGSRTSTEAYLFVGPPKRSIAVATQLSGRPPMPPKWTLGFMNSQWGSTEAEIKRIASEYRAKQIPIDAFILDFDFKAWGEDNYGETRWNSTHGAGAVKPDLFPDGASGAFAKGLADEGFELVGIMKPRFLIETVDHKPTMVAKDAEAHGWWLPNQKPYQDYFSGRLTHDINFAIPDARKWYWSHAKGLFDTGIVGWWNDEADGGFPSFGFGHMQQALYDGQRSSSPLRVWSINRNFYLGDQRYAFGTWSGDIGTGFDVMKAQRTRMMALLDLGQPHWSMDTGGFNGHPSPENYARWMEFASVVPIMRVHGTYGEKRQPWVYGPVAEAAAKKAIEFRTTLLPSLYSWEHEANLTGVGIARPMFWEFPDDPACVNLSNEWMLGEGLMVAPVVDKGATSTEVYLPAGTWYDYVTGERFEGGKTITKSVDSVSWADLPRFVRGGTILATVPVHQFAADHPATQLRLDVWTDPSRTAEFTVYDDDGATYGYERGRSFMQRVTATEVGDMFSVHFEPSEGSYKPTFQSYKVVLHFSDGRTTEAVVQAGRKADFHAKRTVGRAEN